MKVYISFGQSHEHMLDGTPIDKDCLLEIECENEAEARAKAFELFGSKWGTSYVEDDIYKEDITKFYPRGVIPYKPEVED